MAISSARTGNPSLGKLKLCQQRNSQPITTLLSVVLLLTTHVPAVNAWAGEVNTPYLTALLVGVDDYPHLPENAQLSGSRNDIGLVEELLRSRFQFPANNIATLTDTQATGLFIRESFEKILDQLQQLPSDRQAYVVFHFSGHGSQLSDQIDGPLRDEMDGLDETILPSDATSQGSDIEIRDDELNEFAHRVCARSNTHLWMILDCCHSGTGVRGSQTTRFRALPRRVLGASTQHQPLPPPSERELPANVVALYACQSIEKEPEYTDGIATYGLLTKSLTDVLTQTKKVSALTYARLVELIESKYRTDRRVVPAPKPSIEGAKHSIVCGAHALLDHDDWQVFPDSSDPTQAWIQAGKLDGISAGSLFELDWPEEDEQSSSAPTGYWLGVTTVEPTASHGQLFQHDGITLSEAQWPTKRDSGIAIERYHQPNETTNRVRVIVSRGDGSEQILAPHSQDELAQQVRSIFENTRPGTRPAETNHHDNWIEWADESSAYDLVLKIDGTEAALFPATAMAYASPVESESSSQTPSFLRGGWGPYDLTSSPKANLEVREAIYRICRARNLLQVADTQIEHSPIRLDLQLERLDVQHNRIVSRTAWNNTSTDRDPVAYPIVEDGDCYDWVVTYDSETPKPAFLTLLQINSDMGIQMLIPRTVGSPSPMIANGESLRAGGYECCRDDDGQPRLGPRWTIAIATYAPNQYSWLGQNSLTRIRGLSLLSQPLYPHHRSTLDDLLLRDAFFQTRGDSSTPETGIVYDPSWSVTTQRWTAVAQQETTP